MQHRSQSHLHTICPPTKTCPIHRCDIPPMSLDNGLCLVTTYRTIPSTGIPFTIDVPYEFTLPNITKIGAVARDDRLDLYGVVERLFERLVWLLNHKDHSTGTLFSLCKQLTNGKAP